MANKTPRLAALAAATLSLLVACGGPPQGPPAGPTAVFGDDDLANAQPLTVEGAVVAGRTLDLTLDVGEASSLPSYAGVLEPQQLSGPGYIAVAEREQGGAYRVVVYEDAAAPSDPELVFAGQTEVQSVAIDVAGTIMLVSADTPGAGLEAYVFDLAGRFGPAETAYLLPGTGDDEADVSMSSDGRVWAHSSVDSGGMGNAVVYFANLVSGDVERATLEIAIGGTRYPMSEPSLSGDGSVLVFPMDATAHPTFRAPVIVAFSTTEDAGELLYEGVFGSTSHLGAPSLSYDAGLLAFAEVQDGVHYVRAIDLDSSTTYDVIEDADFDHPHLAPTADLLVYALDGTAQRAGLELEPSGATLTPVALEPSVAGATAYAPYIASVPPSPELPEDAVQYEGDTSGAGTWLRPEPPAPGTAGPVGYHAHDYTAPISGVYSIESVQDFDGFLLLYEDDFDPALPHDNLVAYNDDDPAPGSSRLLVPLPAGDYVIVTTGFGPGDEGEFVNTIIPPQAPEPEGAPQIELIYTDSSIVETDEVMAMSWYASSATAVTCEVDWGDGTVEEPACGTDGLQTATHAYDTEGPYVITVTVTNENGSDTAKVFPTVHDDDPASFDIVVVFANDGLSPSQVAAFQGAADRWADVISGDLPAGQDHEVPANLSCAGEPAFTGHIDDLVISATGVPIDGPGDILGQAGPCLFRSDDSNGDLAPLPLYGIMRFDTADLDDLESSGGLSATILHEMGHVLGIGTLWEDNDLLEYSPAGPCRTVNFTTPPVFTGVFATTQHEALGGDGHPLVEDQHGPGTRCGHWDEETYQTELMTGFLDGGSQEISVMTIGSLEDLGYEVDLTAADTYSVPALRAAGVQEVLGHDGILSFPKYR